MPDELPEGSKKYPDDKMRCYACKVRDQKLGGEFIYCLEHGKFNAFEYGIWKEIFDLEIQGRISEAMPEINRFALSRQQQIIGHLKIMRRVHLKDFNWSELLNLNNGMLNPYDCSLLSHDPIYYSTIRMSYDFEPEATSELWNKTLMEIFEGDINKINTLQEFFGYCLTRDTRMEKAMLLLGESRSGKSTILHTMRAMLGDKNCSSVPLKYISNPQYTSMLINKLINIDADVSGKAQDFEAEFKTITSGEPVSCSPKYVPNFEFNPFCKLIMAANEFPHITDHSSAFYKRLIIIPCNRVFEEKEINRDLKNQLVKELPGILNWALVGRQRMYERKGFEQHDFMREAVDELREDSNPIDKFFKDHIVIENGAELEKSDLYNRYVRWSGETNTRTLSVILFSKCFYRKYLKQTPKNSQSPTGKRIWRNLRYVDNMEIIQNKGWHGAAS